MSIERLDTSDPAWLEDPRLADYRTVRDPELVRRHARFLAEGRMVVRTLLTESPLRTHSVLLEEAALAALQDASRSFPPDVPVYVVPPGALSALSGFRFHQGCLAVGERPPARSAAALLDSLPGDAPFVVALDGVSNPDNVGAIFRTASALGVHGIVLSPECASPLYRKAIRTSMGAALRLPFSHGPAWDEAVSGMQARGYLLLALTPASEARRLDDVAVALPGDRPRALLLGAEGLGLRTSSLTAADIRVRIPMSGGVDSLNVAAAAAVALYRLRP